MDGNYYYYFSIINKCASAAALTVHRHLTHSLTLKLGTNMYTKATRGDGNNCEKWIAHALLIKQVLNWPIPSTRMDSHTNHDAFPE